ncbi:MAG: hypothetical protein WCI73_09415, partial [Phycisphaerae bacterium]
MNHTDDQSPAMLPPTSDCLALTAHCQSLLDSLKIRLTDEQVAIRKDRYTRQGFVPPGILWQGRLLSDAVDKQIAAKLGLPFETRDIDLANEEEAQLWVIEHTLEMPELNTFQKVQ